MGGLGDIGIQTSPKGGTMVGFNVESLCVPPRSQHNPQALQITFPVLQVCGSAH